jgi:23S rRNA (pseudouridine1915-N3)-methyltransferase
VRCQNINIRIIAVGKIKEDFFKRGIEHYLIRLRPYSRVEVIELPEAKAGEKRSSQAQKVLEEAPEMIKNFRDGAHLIVLSAEGEKMSSEEFAFYLERLLIEGKSKVDFIIGGPSGLAESIKKKGDLCLSLSDLTFPHRLVRLILLEQLYRCFKIIRGEPYHK